MAVMRATSRLTFWTSSSENCCRRSALDCSPSTTSSMAALRKPGMASSLMVLRIMAGGPRASCLFLTDPGAHDLRRDVRILGDLFTQVLGKHFGLLGDHRRELQGGQRLSVHFLLQGVALRQLRFQLLLEVDSRQAGRTRRAP